MTVRSRLVTLVAAGLFAAVGGPATAGAPSAVQSGWWTSAPVAVGPDVADNQLLVQGGPDPSRPVAYAGITFALASDETPQKLVLSVAPNSATTPGATLALCRLGAPAYPAKGDPASGGPPVDCATKVEGSPSANGATYEFAVTRLATQGALDIAVLPTKPTDRVVLTKPRVDALQSGSGVSTSPSPGEPSGTGGVSGAGSSDVGGIADSGSSGGGAVGAVDLGAGGALAETAGSPVPGPAATASANTDASPPNARLSTPAVSRSSGGSSRPVAPFAFAGMAAGAVVLWALAGQRSPEAAGETAETSDTGGFG